MPKCHKTHPNCIWHVFSKWHRLNFDSALLTKIYWNYATHIVRVCVFSTYSINPNLPLTSKSSLQVTFGSRAMASLYEFYDIIISRLTILASKNCFPISLVDFLQTSLIIMHMKAPMTNQSDRLTLQSLHSTLTMQLTFLKNFHISSFLYATPTFVP